MQASIHPAGIFLFPFAIGEKKFVISFSEKLMLEIEWIVCYTYFTYGKFYFYARALQI